MKEGEWTYHFENGQISKKENFSKGRENTLLNTRYYRRISLYNRKGKFGNHPDFSVNSDHPYFLFRIFQNFADFRCIANTCILKGLDEYIGLNAADSDQQSA